MHRHAGNLFGRLLWLAGFIIALCISAPVLAGTWTQLGALNTPRDNASVVLLPNGVVLVAGGANAGGTLSSAELYNPATGTFSITGSLTTARQNATATMLTNGTVLIAGGTNGPGALASAEIYNPATASFTATGSMTTARNSATATLLADGSVLLAGGANGATSIAGAELYDAVSGQFTPTGSLQTARSLATASLLPDGRVLIGGGQPSGFLSDSLATTEIYDPSAGTFGAGAPLTVSRESATATLLPSGKVLIAGGYSIVGGTSQVLASAELYDSLVDASIATGAMANARYGAIAALLPSGDVLIAGGSNSVFVGNSLASAETYAATSGTFSSAGSMTNARNGASATLLPNAQVLVVGGATSGTFPAQAESYDASTGTFTATGSLPALFVCGTPAPLPNGQVLLMGCSSPDAAEAYDPTTGIFTVLSNRLAVGEGPAVTLLGNGQVLIVGPNPQGTAGAAEQFDPVAGTFTQVGSPPRTFGEATSTLLADGRVLLAGGIDITDSGVFSVSDAVIYDPATHTFGTEVQMHVPRDEATATLLPNGKVLIAGGDTSGELPVASAELYDPKDNFSPFTFTGSLSDSRAEATATLLPNGKVLIAGGGDANGFLVTTAELYDPATGIFSATGSLLNGREFATAILLPNGKVLIVGGSGSSSAELYDPATGLFSSAGTMTTARTQPTAILLPNGKVLIAGGGSATAELYDPGAGFQDSRRAQIDRLSLSAATQPLALNLAGAGFRASTEQAAGAAIGSEASSGDSQSAATNYPLLQLRRVDNDQQFFISPDATQLWTDTRFTTSTLSGLPLGFYRATLFVNGIPSQARLISLAPALIVTAIGGDQQTATVAAQFAQPLQVLVTDTDSNPIQGVSVSFPCTPASDGACIVPTSNQTSDIDGMVSVPITANHFSGNYTVQASAGSGNTPAVFTLSNAAGPAANLNPTGATSQSTQVGTAFAIPLQVEVTDIFNNPVPNVIVRFLAPGSGATTTPTNVFSETTVANGEAEFDAGANTIAGSYVVTASVDPLSTQFNLTNTPAPAANIASQNGPDFNGTAGLALATPPAVVVTDAFGNPIAGVAVTFAAGDNSGSITEENPLTDSTGTASAGSWTLAADPGTNTLQASASGLAGSPVQFNAVGSASVDVAVTMTNNRGFVQFGHTLDYVIVVTAAGPSNAHNVLVTDLLPSQVDAANAHWVCLPAVGASCTASGSGDLVGQSADIPSGSSVTYVLSATVLDNQAVDNDTITNTVSVSVDGDTDPSNNTETVVTQAVIFRNAFEEGGDGSH